jgi:hypothetical protein
MMRFRCPNCQQVLELSQFTPTLLCPSCERWCRIPIPNEFELSGGPTTITTSPNSLGRYEPRLERSQPQPSPASPKQPSLADYGEDAPLRFQDEEVSRPDRPMDVLPADEEQPSKPRRRRRRRRSRGVGIDIDYWISPTLILLILLGPPSLLAIIISFILHPGIGFGMLVMLVGWLWTVLVAAEDSLATALMVVFVPFYYWFFVFTNFERVALPFLIHSVGSIILILSVTMGTIHTLEESSLPFQFSTHGSLCALRFH